MSAETRRKAIEACTARDGWSWTNIVDALSDLMREIAREEVAATQALDFIERKGLRGSISRSDDPSQPSPESDVPSDPDSRYPDEDVFGPPALCRGCGGMLLPEYRRIADGCACNSGRGINHGLVPKNTCTCVECDPAQTGSTRYPPIPPQPSPEDAELAEWLRATQRDYAGGIADQYARQLGLAADRIASIAGLEAALRGAMSESDQLNARNSSLVDRADELEMKLVASEARVRELEAEDDGVEYEELQEFRASAAVGGCEPPSPPQASGDETTVDVAGRTVES